MGSAYSIFIYTKGGVRVSTRDAFVAAVALWATPAGVMVWSLLSADFQRLSGRLSYSTLISAIAKGCHGAQ